MGTLKWLRDFFRKYDPDWVFDPKLNPGGAMLRILDASGWRESSRRAAEARKQVEATSAEDVKSAIDSVMKFVNTHERNQEEAKRLFMCGPNGEPPEKWGQPRDKLYIKVAQKH